LQQLKVEIGGDGNSNAGSEPSTMHFREDANFTRGVGWWLMREARRRNPQIKLTALAWNFPGWVERGYSPATIEYLTRYLEGAERTAGIRIDYVGIWNETKMDPRFITDLRRSLDEHGLATRIVADDLVNTWDIVEAMKRDAALRAAVAVMGTHYPQPRFVTSDRAKRASRDWGKPIWSTEDGPWADSWGADGQQTQSYAGSYAEVINRNYVQGRLTSTNFWALLTAAPDNLGLPHAGLFVADSPWSGHYELKSPLWVVAHTTQFAQPGWRYSDSASGLLPAGGSYVTLHSAKDYSVVAETLRATVSQRLELEIKPPLDAGPVSVWRSTPRDWFRKVATVQPVAGRITYQIEPNSVYTMTSTAGQHKGDAGPPPPPHDFPVPYREDFERYSLGDTLPRYLIEQNGSYEIAACGAGRPGQCLAQVVDRVPVPWRFWGDSTLEGAPDLFGDRRWRDYRVGVQSLLEQPGYVMLVGRVSHADCDGTLIGYQFRLYDTGRWELHAAVKDGLIAAGQSAAVRGRWHDLELVFHGQWISGQIDGQPVFEMLDTRHMAGMAGFGTGWNRAQFDDLTLDPVSADVPVISESPVRQVTGPLAAPELLSPITADRALRLTWRPVAGATSYHVRIGTAPHRFDRREDAGAELTYEFKILTNGIKYYFQVAAVSTSGEGKWSATQHAVPGPQ
jgi:hypothetical protein